MNEGRGLTGRALGPFLALSFGLTWGIGGLLMLFGPRLEAVFGKLSGTNPLFILAVYSPAFAAIFLVWRHHGLEGLRSFLGRLTLWRMPAGWWVFLLLGLPAVFYAGAAIMTPMFNASRGSLLVAALMHFQANGPGPGRTRSRGMP